jgi:hypothetical protein
MRTNNTMSQRLARAAVDPLDVQVQMSRRLQNLVQSPLRFDAGCVVLEPLATKIPYDPDKFYDRTGYECFVNKIHVVDYIDESSEKAQELLGQGLKYGFELGKRLAAEGTFLVVLSLDHDSGDVIVLFHKQREGEQWLSDNLEGYKTDDVLAWDTGDFSPH